MDVAMNLSARPRRLLAFGLAALLHVSLVVIPLPRSVKNSARPGIEPAPISIEVVSSLPAHAPEGERAQPSAGASSHDDSAAQAAERAAHVARVARVHDSHAQRVSAAHAAAPRSRVDIAPAESHAPGTIGLQPVNLDLSRPAPVAALDGLSERAPAGSGAGTSGPGLASSQIDRHAYALRVRGLVQARKRYPARARRRDQEGEVSVRVRIAPDGSLLGQPRITASSGAEALDREAVRMVRRASPFPPSGAATAIDIAVPVRFALDQR